MTVGDDGELADVLVHHPFEGSEHGLVGSGDDELVAGDREGGSARRYPVEENITFGEDRDASPFGVDDGKRVVPVSAEPRDRLADRCRGVDGFDVGAHHVGDELGAEHVRRGGRLRPECPGG